MLVQEVGNGEVLIHQIPRGGSKQPVRGCRHPDDSQGYHLEASKGKPVVNGSLLGKTGRKEQIGLVQVKG